MEKRMKQDRKDQYGGKEDFFKKLQENYDQIRPINSGGGGIIYEGVHRRLQQKVVLKKIRADKLSVIGKEREMQILMNLKHTYLPRIVDFWSYEDEVYTVMEFIEGRSFKELLDEGKTFSQKDVIRFTRQLAEVLEYLHNSPEHIVHGDIKPANLMLTPRGDICLIDFNVSILRDGEEDETIGYSNGYSPVEQFLKKEAEREKSGFYNRQAQEAVGGGAGRSFVCDDATEVDDDATEVDEDVRGAYDDVTEVDGDVRRVYDDATEVDEDVRRADEDATEVDTGIIKADAAQQVRSAASLSEKKPAGGSASGNVAAQQRQEAAQQMLCKYGRKLKIDERSDIYSACATMYHILSGVRPAACYERITPIEDLVPSVDDAFAYVLMHGLEQDPAKRFQTSGQWLKAIRQMARSSRRYKRMRRIQDSILLILFAVFICCAGSVYVGWNMRLEEGMLRDLAAAREYYDGGQYEEAEKYLQQHILDNSLYRNESGLSEAYYMLGNVYLQEEAYPDAIDAYRKAILLDSDQADYYRDYGIALARSGNLDLAQEVLLQAKARGIAEDSINLLQGEIALLGKDYTAAGIAFMQCLENSSDSAIRMRAYLQQDQVLAESGGNEAYPERIQLLEEACAEFTDNRDLLLLERLVQVYGDYGQQTGDPQYTGRAVELLTQIIDSGYGSLAEWLNKAVYLQSMAEYEQARSCLEEAAEKFPENYLIYKRLAYLEMDVQSALDGSERDYGRFQQYFTEADRLYEQEGPNREQDLEMDFLYQVYDEVVTKGWLTQ